MAELLSREKEFIKLNQELDKMATAPAEQQQQQHTGGGASASTNTGLSSAIVGASGTSTTASCSASAGGGGGTSTSSHTQSKHDPRFLTYTKPKGTSQTTRKRGASTTSGAGDGAADTITELPSDRLGYRNMRHSKGSHQSSTSTTPSLRPDGDGFAALSIASNTTENAKHGKTSNTASTHRKQIKSPDSSTRTHSRTSSSRMSGSTSPFTVRYRNPKFVQSPSLEVLIKDEGASIRQSTTLTQAECESITSAITGISTGGATTRRMDGTARRQFSSDSLIKFLKSKIAILEEDHDRISQEMSEQKELLEKTLERSKKIEQQRDQAYLKHNAIAEQLTKTENQLEEVTRRIKDRVVEQSSQLKELEVAKRELKLLTQTNTNLEKRLYRATEELENTKNALTILKNAEREMKETMRQDNDTKDKQIKSLKKQRADLLNAYKKQLFLIDNLKRQNICMEQSKMIGFGEKEFTKVLDWNSKI